MKVREAVRSDLPKLLQFEQGVIEAERPFAPQIRDKTTYYDLEGLLDSENSCLAVAEENGELAGSGYVQIRKAEDYFRHEFYAYIGFLYVCPELRGRGIVREVENYLTDWAKSRGIKHADLEVYSENISAVKAYEKAGYKPLTQRMTKAL